MNLHLTLIWVVSALIFADNLRAWIRSKVQVLGHGGEDLVLFVVLDLLFLPYVLPPDWLAAWLVTGLLVWGALRVLAGGFSPGVWWSPARFVDAAIVLFPPLGVYTLYRLDKEGSLK